MPYLDPLGTVNLSDSGKLKTFKCFSIHYGGRLMIQASNSRSFQNVRILPYGERGYLLDQLSDQQRSSVEQAVMIHPPGSFSECVRGADNLLMLFEKPVSECVLFEYLNGIGDGLPSPSNQSRRVEVPVRYDGADLPLVAQATGLSEAEIVAIHSAPEYRVRMMGFTPGFPYLDGLDARLHLDRHASPRDRIEPGAVAIGGCHAGIYSVGSPGGWHLLGHTDVRLFNPDQARGSVRALHDVFAFEVDDRVKFVAI